MSAETIRRTLKRYRFFIAMLAANLGLLLWRPETGETALSLSLGSALEMLTIIPPIFLLLGLLDVWVERETMVRFMGAGSGLRGLLVAFTLGSAAAGPLYAAFPVAGMFLKKGASWFNVFVFIGAWSTTKIPLLLFESASLGVRFMLLRFIFNAAGILLITFLMNRDGKPAA